MPNEKTWMLLERCFRLIHSAHFGPARSLPQQSSQLGKLGGAAGGVNLDVAIVQVARPSRQSDRVGGALDKKAEPDALNAPAHAIESR